MSLLEKVCKELGVEIGEEWEANNGLNYTISETGAVFEYYRDGFCIGTNPKSWEKILTGELKPVWKPKKGERYFIPHLTDKENLRYERIYWTDDEIDKWFFKNNLVFKTEEEAIETTNKILNIVRKKEED